MIGLPSRDGQSSLKRWVGFCWKLRHTRCSSHFYWGLRTIVLIIVMSSILRGSPFLGAFRLACLCDKTHVRYTANRRCLQSNSFSQGTVSLPSRDGEASL